MFARTLILLVVGFGCSLAIAGDTYRWEDKKGRVYYSDQPPPPGARNIRRTRAYDDEEERSLPHRLQVVVERSPVTLYVTDCGKPCDSARELLIGRGVPHTLLDASEAEVQQELVALNNGQLEVPVVLIGKVVVRGFEESQWNSVLDVAGYPSYAMIEVEPYVPTAAQEAAVRDGDNDEVAADDSDGLDAAAAESDERFLGSETGGAGERVDEDAEPADIEPDE